MDRRIFGCVLSCALAIATLRAQVAIPPQTAEVKFQNGRILTLETADGGGAIVLSSRDGQVLRTIAAGEGVAGIRHAEIKDFTLAADGTLAVSLGAQFPFAASSRLLGLYGEKGEPRFLTLDDQICLKMAADARTGIWCLGPGLEDGLLHRVFGEGNAPWSLLLRKQVRITANAAGEPREAYDAGPAGVPALMPSAPGKLLAWLPNAGAVHEVDTASGRVNAWPVPLAFSGRSLITATATGDGGIYALLPLRAAAEPERLSTPYGVFRLNRETGAWLRLPRLGAFPRGSALSGADGLWLVVWNRAQKVLIWLDPR